MEISAQGLRDNSLDRFIKCSICKKLVGQKGDSPTRVRKLFRQNNEDVRIYYHKDCLP